MRTIITALLVLASVPLFAFPTSLVSIPSTDVQPNGTWHLLQETYVYDGGASLSDTGLVYGFLKRAEVGVDLYSGTTKPIFGNAKVQVLTPDESPVPVAVGLFNAGEGPDNDSAYYAVASTTFTNEKTGKTPGGACSWHVVPTCLNGTRLTFGAYKGRKDVLGDDSASGALLGVDRTIKKYWLGVDYYSGQNSLGSVNAGVGYNITDLVQVILGFDHYNDREAVGASSSENFQFIWNF